MSQIIEHSTTEGVMGAFESCAYVKCAVWQGTEPLVVYEGEDKEEAKQLIDGWLESLAQLPSTAVYKLRVYGDDVKNITNKSPYKAVTRFQFNTPYNSQQVQGPDGKIILMRDVNRTPAVGNTGSFNERLNQLELENKQLVERVHKAELASLEERFNAKIAGLSAAPEMSIVDKIDGIIDKLLNKVEPVFNIIGKLKGQQQNYILTNTVPVNGTTHKTQAMADEEVQDPVIIGRIIDKFLTAEQQKLKKHEQGAILKAALEAMNAEELDDLQVQCLELIEPRIGNVTLTRMLVVVQGLDDHDMNKLLNNLD